MAFVTDKQTITDLGIFGKPGADAVFSIYNRTATAGGANVLKEMFTYPLNDANAINERIKIFQQFAASQISFPFQTELFSIAEHYLENADQRTKLTQTQSGISKKIIDFVAPDAAYKTLVKGITSLRTLLIKLWDFLQTLSLYESESFKKQKEIVIGLLKEEPFNQLVLQKKNEIPKQEQLVELDALFRFKKRGEIKKILQFIYQLDAYIAVGKTARERNFCFPKVLDKEICSVKLENVYHPLLKNPVANSIEISRDKNLVFLTGANMAGKSTLMKTLGIAIFLAHAGFPVPATSMEFSVMDGLFTTINLSDNINQQASHFYAEVLRIKKVANELNAGKKLFVIFDELFRGTNVKDAYEATVAVTAAFAEKQDSMFVISTHIIEAGEVLKEECRNIQFRYLPTKMEGNTPVYSYVLKEGVTDDRQGMVIIQNEGILDILNGKRKLVNNDEFYNR